MNVTLKRPEPAESNDYYKTYISKVDGDNYLTVLEMLMSKTIGLLNSLDTSKWNHRYAEGKWSIKEVMIHVLDTERIMAYRALRIARNDKTPMPGFDQDDYMPFTDAENRNPQSIIEEYIAVRKGTIEMFKYFTDEMLGRVGTASGNPFTPRALGYIIAGHELHHMRIVRERYLV